MQEQILEDLSAATRTSYEAFQELGQINTSTIEKLAQLQFGMASLGIEGSMEQAKLLTSTTNYQDLLSAESDFASSYSEKVMNIARQTADALSESREEFTNWFEKNSKVLAETAQSAAVATSARPARKPTAKKASTSTARKSA